MGKNIRLLLGALLAVSQFAVASAYADAHLEPLPATGNKERPLILLEAEPVAAVKTTGDAAISICGGKVLSHDGESCGANESSVILGKQGNAATKISFSFTLEPKFKTGRYNVWTAISCGGVGTQKFTIKAGASQDSLGERLTFQQMIEPPWKIIWRKGQGTLTLRPEDSVLVVESEGVATQAKVFDAFLLAPADEPLSSDAILGVETAREDIFKPYLEGIPKIAGTLSEEVKDGVRITRLRYQSVEGSDSGIPGSNEIYAVIGRPEKEVAGKRPAMLVCHGGGGSALELNVAGWAQLGFVALSMDLPGHMGEKDIKSVTRVKGRKYASGLFAFTPDPRRSADFDTIVSGLMGFNLLASQADVDPARIGVTGISWGGYTSLMLASLLGDRLAAGFALYGAGFYPLSNPGIGSPICQLSNEEQMLWMRNFDPGPRARSIKAPFLMYPAANDIYFLPPAVMGTYAAIGSSKRICFGPNQSHWIALPGGTVSWTNPTFTDMEAAYFLYVFDKGNPPLPQPEIVSKCKERPAFTVKDFPADGASLWAYYSINDDAPWPKREWRKVDVVKGDDGVFRPSIPDGLARCDWYGGVSFTLTAGTLKRPMSLSTVIAHFEAK